MLLAIVQDNEEAVKLILEYCKKYFFDINAKDSKGIWGKNVMTNLGNTVLHLAAMHAGESTTSILQLLRFEHLQVNIANINGSTPLHYFAQTVRPEKADQIVYQLILAGADPNYQNNAGETPLHRFSKRFCSN